MWLRLKSFSPFSQPLVPRENITAWMNAIGLVITALPVRKHTENVTSFEHFLKKKKNFKHLSPPVAGTLLDRPPRPHHLCAQLAGADVGDRVGGGSVRLAGLHRLPPKLQRNELQLRAGADARRVAPLVHRTALSDSQVSRPTFSFTTCHSVP